MGESLCLRQWKKQPNSVSYFKNAFTQAFLHAIAIEPHEGNLTALKADAALNKATQYWITEDLLTMIRRHGNEAQVVEL